MKHLLLSIAALIACGLGLALADEAPLLRSDHLMILSTTDVKGKTGPCGCRIPKGGLSRQASYADSVRQSFGQVLWVDNGGFFPEEAARRDAARFLLSAMHALGIRVVGVGPRDLRYGAEVLLRDSERAGVPLVCANLIDARTHAPLTAPSRLERVGGVRVGVFGLITPQAELGPSKDSLIVQDPRPAAKAAVAALRAQGADVVLLLSQLGWTETEDLVGAVDGIDAVIVGHGAPVFANGRMVKNTIACYGGEQGQFLCVTDLTLNPEHQVVGRVARVIELSPEVGEKPQVQSLVKAFEDGLSEKLRAQGITPPPSGASEADSTK